MSDNNEDFEEDFLYEENDEDDGSSESIYTENSELTSREKVDQVLDGTASDAMQKMGVSKGAADKAVKSGGGTFSPTNLPANKIAKEKSRNTVAKAYDKARDGQDAFQRRLNNKDYYNNQLKNAQNRQKNASDKLEKNQERRDSATESLTKAKENKKNNNNKQTRSELKDAKKENKAANKEQKEEKNNKKNAIKDIKNIKKDAKKAKRYAITHPGQVAADFLKKKIKKIIIAIAPIILGIFLIIFTIELITGAIMDAFGAIDSALTGAANFSEKVDNFYRGFGFQDSEQAFYDELNRLCEKYNGNLDEVLILSTIFYMDSMQGYDTDYSVIDSAVDQTVSGSNSNVFSVIRKYAKEKFDEANQTVSEEGLVFNTGKIYRLRKLARNQFSTGLFGLTKREGAKNTVSLGNFLDMYSEDISKDVLDLLKRFIGISIDSFFGPFKDLWAFIVGSEYTTDKELATGDLVDSFKSLLSDIFYGLVSIDDVDVSLKGITITYSDYVFDQDNYDAYLRNYYIEEMPEFQSILPAKGTQARKNKIEEIINQIYENKNLFEDIYLQYNDATSEVYTESCVGAIDNVLISELGMPIDKDEDVNINFNENSAYGIKNGLLHTGVDLNESSSGSKEGYNVYSIFNGVIEEINLCENSNQDSCSDGAYIIIGHTVIIDNNEYKFSSVYKHLDRSSIVLEKKSVVSKGTVIGKIGGVNSGYTESYLHFEFKNDEGISIDPSNLFIKCQSGILKGNTDEEKIYNYLISSGYPKAGAAGIMGNMKAESGFISNRVQEDYLQSDPDSYRKNYTQNVDSGRISKNDFIYNGPGGGGYGLVQWTSSGRKEKLYNSSKEKKVSIGDLLMQLNYLDYELKNDYSGVYSVVSNPNSSISESARKFMLEFERPADQSESAQQGRINNSQNIYNKYSN